jgi:hypothetical protein
MNKKRFFHNIFAVILAVCMALGLSACGTLMGLLSHGPYDGESEPLLAGTTWTIERKPGTIYIGGTTITFKSSGKLAPFLSWGSNTWERVGNTVRIIANDKSYYKVGTYDPYTQKINGATEYSNGVVSTWIYALKSGSLPPLPPKNTEPVIRKPVLKTEELTRLELAYAYNKTYRDIEAKGRRLKVWTREARNQFIQQYQGFPDTKEVLSAYYWELEYFKSDIVSAEEIVIRAKNEPNEFRKIRLLHDWVADIFAYDYSLLNWMDIHGRNAEFTLQQIAQREKGVCMEYSVLFYFLADSVGLDTYLISDHTIPNGGGHAYNMVVVNGTGYIIDTTWDSGNISDVGGKITFQRRFEKNYFMPSIALSYYNRNW